MAMTYLRLARRTCLLLAGRALPASVVALVPCEPTADELELAARCIISRTERHFFDSIFAKKQWQLKEADPPSPPAVPHIRRRYGMEWSDEYTWMETRSDETYRHLYKENTYARAVLSGVKPLADRLKKEMLERLPEEQPGIPERLGVWDYRTIQEAGAPMPNYVRRRIDSVDDDAGIDEVILDCNELEAIHGHGKVGELKVSRCQNLVAYTVGGGGDEQYSCWVRDLRSRRLLVEDTIVTEQGIGSVEWTPDSTCLLYTDLDDAGRPARVMRHRLGTAVGQDEEVFQEPDPAAYLDISRTKDWAFALVNVNSKAFSEVHLLCSDGSSPRLISRRRHGHQYFVEHSHGYLVILSNRLASGLELFSVPAEGYGGKISEGTWRLLHPREEGVELEDLDMFSSQAVLYQRYNGIPKVSVLPMPPSNDDEDRKQCNIAAGDPPASKGLPSSNGAPTLPLPSWTMSLQPGVNPDPESKTLLLGVSSPIHPLHWLRFSLDHPLDPPEVVRIDGLSHVTALPENATETPNLAPSSLLHHSASHTSLAGGLVCTRLEAPSTDDTTTVPVTVFHRSDLPLDGTSPMLLSMYGAYGMAMEVDFCSHRLSLLERGWVIALAHCRGGGELGQAWHKAGSKRNKPNSLADASAVLDALIKKGYSAPGKVALQAFSAGGLLLGHLINSSAPGLIAAAWAQAPFVDLLTASTDPDLPLTVHEFDEWGDPDDPEALQVIASVCPYYNSAQKKGVDRTAVPQTGVSSRNKCPAVLVSVAMDDVRVPFWGPAKWVARLRAASSCSNEGPVVVLKVNETGGHFGIESTRVEELAEGYAFLIASLERNSS